jgi:methionyl-tRNA formyltransferase
MVNGVRQVVVEQPLRIYFLGSGAIGVAALQSLMASPRIQLVGIGTQPDRPKGRRRHLSPTPVGAFAAEHSLAADKPASVNAPEFLARLQELSLDLVVVIAFGQILGRRLLELPRLGCLNVHASLLPRHRGASPVRAALLAGDSEAGITFMKMDAGLDTGPIYRQARVAVAPQDTAASLEDKLAALASTELVPTVVQIVREQIQPVPQDDSQATYAPKISKADGRLDWCRPARILERQVRAFFPWPMAFFTLPGGRRVQVTQAMVTGVDLNAEAGEVVQADKHGWVVACGEDALELQQVVPEGKSEMTGVEFVRGARLAPGIRL